MTDLFSLSALLVLNEIKNKSVTVEEIILKLIKKISKVNKKINALVYFNEEALLKEAKNADEKIAENKQLGPLFGLPISIKDNIEVKGMITTGGIEGRKNYVPTVSATVVNRLKKAGAIILGKTNCPAFCAGFETINDVYGQTNNPYNLGRTVGSSSGGEAALIAAGGSFLGLGSDSGGSIRWPSSFCGIASIVPTFGRVPRTGTIPPYLGFLDTSQIGPMAKTVKDLIPIFQVIMGPDNWDPRCIPMPFNNPYTIDLEGLKVAFYSDNDFVTPEPIIKRIVENIANKLVKKNIEVRECIPPATKDYLEIVQGLNAFSGKIDQKSAPKMQELVAPVEFYPTKIYEIVNNWLEESKKTKGDQAMLGVEYHFWSYKWDAYRSKMLQFMNDFDAIVCPVSAIPAFKHGDSTKKDFQGMNLLSYTHPYSYVGFPAVTLKGGKTTDGLPVGFQIVTSHGKEALALKLGLYLEEQLDGWEQPEI